MPPKRARKAPAKKERAASSHSAADPVPSSSSSSSSSSSLSSSPHSTVTAVPSAPHARRSPSPSPAPQKKKPQGTAAAATAPSSPASSCWCYGLALVFILAAIGYASTAGGHSSRPHHPCACATAAAAAANPLAKALLSRRSGVSGVHWQPEGGASRWLDKAALCSDVRVVELSRRYTAVPQLRQDLIKAFESDRSQCVVWVTAPDAVKAVANSLKELLENNALGGVPVVPPHARGTLVVKSAQSREALKEALPHRVVHMLTTLT